MNGFKQVWAVCRRLGFRSLKQKPHCLLGLCIFVCAGIAAMLSFFANSVQLALDRDIANYLGAPIVLRSDSDFSTKSLNLAAMDKVVETASFTIGALGPNTYQSVSLKGVSSDYPLQGDLVINTNGVETNASALQLADNSVWLDQRALLELQVEVGETIQIGRSELLVAGELVHEPDRLTQLQHALPRAMVNLNTLNNTGVARENDRGEHRLLLAGSESALGGLEATLSHEDFADVEILKPGKGQHPFSRISMRAERLLSLMLVLILLMCGGAAASLGDHIVNHYALPATVLRCMGVKRRTVAWALCLQLMGIALLMSLLGCALAWGLQPLLNQLMQPHMVIEVAPLSGTDLIAPIAIGLLTVIAFVIPKLHHLGKLPVSSVLRGQIEQPSRFGLSTVLVSILVFSILWLSSDNIHLSLLLVGGVIALVGLSALFGWFLSKFTAQAHHGFRGPIKVAVRSIGRSSGRHIAPLTSVAIAMMAVLLTLMLRSSFLDRLQTQMLETDGNYIFTGLPAAQSNAFTELVNNTGAIVKAMHPTVSAKLVAINGVDFERAMGKDSDTREEARSKVRLSWAESLPSNNRLLNGSWPRVGSNEVSVEAEVMTDLGLVLGDALSFAIGDQVLNATITSRREYKGGGSRMMFWFMFSESALQPYEQHMMGGLLISTPAQPLLSQLGAKFSQVRVTDLERMISGIRDIMIVLTRLMNTALLLLLSSALMVIIVNSFVAFSNRSNQMQLMRALGLRRRQCYVMNMAEQFVIGLAACLVGVLAVQLIAGALFQNLFALPYQLDWQHVLSLGGLICASFVVVGFAFSLRQLRREVTLS